MREPDAVAAGGGDDVAAVVRRVRPQHQQPAHAARAAGLERVGDQPGGAAGGVRRSLPQPGRDDHRRRRGVETVASSAFKPFDAGVAVAGALLGVAVGRADRVIDVEVASPRRRSAIIGACRARPAVSRAATASSWRTCPNANARRNVPSVDGARTPVNNRPIAAVAQQVHVLDASPRRRPCPRPARTPSPRPRSPARRHRQMLIGQLDRARPAGPTPAPAPARPPTPDSDRRTPRDRTGAT